MTIPIKQATRKHIFHEITRSLCPDCRRQFRDDPERAVVDAQVLIRDGAVNLRKRCPEHGWHEALILSNAQWYLDAQKYNKPGAIPYDFSIETRKGYPFDCGLATTSKCGANRRHCDDRYDYGPRDQGLLRHLLSERPGADAAG